MPKHFVILGKLESKYLCPYYDNTDIIITSMNSHWDEYLIPRVDLWFDLHENPTKKNANFTKSNFPFDKCHNLLGGRYFCSTMSYIIAWCILEGAEKISIYGCRYTDDGNIRRQRELHNVRELIWFAKGHGVEVEICDEDIEYLLPEHIPDDGADFDQ